MAEPRNLFCFQEKKICLLHLIHIGSRRTLSSFLCSARGMIPLKYVWLYGTLVLLKKKKHGQIIQSSCIYIPLNMNWDTQMCCSVCDPSHCA